MGPIIFWLQNFRQMRYLVIFISMVTRLINMQGILHIVHTLWTCARISFNFLRKTYTFCMEGLYIFHGTAAHILWKNYTFSTETLPIFYRTVIHFVRKSCIFSTENPVHIRFYGSVMHLLRNSYTFSKEVLHIFYGTRVSLTGHRSITWSRAQFFKWRVCFFLLLSNT